MSSPSRNLRAPLLWMLVPLAAGYATAAAWPLEPLPSAWVLTAGAILAPVALGAALAHRPWLWAIVFCFATALLADRYLRWRFDFLHDWQRRPPREATLTLEVQRLFPGSPGARSVSGIGVVAPLAANDRRLHRRIVYFSAIRKLGPVPARSALVRMQGVLEPLTRPVSEHGFDDYLANLGVRHRLTRARVLAEVQPPGRAARLTATLAARFRDYLGCGLEPWPATRSLYLAILLGERADLSSEQENAFVRTGTFHIFSVSGLHVAAIATGLNMLARLARLSKRTGAIVTLAILWLYVEITGASSPALRAYLMVAFLMAARVFRLPPNHLAALVASALATLLVDPLQLFSSGFQMSYTVVAALVLMGGPLTGELLARWQPFAYLPAGSWRWPHRWIRDSGRRLAKLGAACWVAFLGSVPGGIAFFGLFSPGALLANLVVVPLSGAVLWLGFGSLVLGSLGLSAVGAWLNRLAAAAIVAIDRLLQLIVPWPGMCFPAEFRAAWVGPVAMILTIAVMITGASGRWSRRYGSYWPSVAFLGLLLIFGVKFASGR